MGRDYQISGHWTVVSGKRKAAQRLGLAYDHGHVTMVVVELDDGGPMRRIAAGEFKAKCLAILDEVNATGEPVLITKRGKPVARVDVPPREQASESPDSIFGFLRGMATITGDIVSSEHTPAKWDRMFDEKWDRIERESER